MQLEPTASSADLAAPLAALDAAAGSTRSRRLNRRLRKRDRTRPEGGTISLRHGFVVGARRLGHHQGLGDSKDNGKWGEGEVEGERAEVRQQGDRVEALYNFRGGQHDHLVANDGLNADYVREGGRVVIDKFRVVAEEKEGYIRDAEQLARVDNFADGHARAQRLRQLFKEAGGAGPRNDELRRRFEAALQAFYDAQHRRKEERDKRFAAAANSKRRLVSRARELSGSSDWKATGEEMRRLMDSWKSAGFAGKALDDDLWRQFADARGRFFDRRSEEFKKRDKAREESRFKKQRLVSEAKALAESNDFHVAFERMRDLRARWKQAGSAGKDHEEQLWSAFQGAQDRLRGRADQRREAAAHAKRRIVEEASSIAAAGDLRAVGLQWRELMTRWKAAGSAGKLLDDDLWSRLLGYRRQLDARYDQAKAQRAQKTREFLTRLEQAAQRKREALARVENHLNDLHMRPPIRPGPRAYEFIAQRESKISGLSMKRDSIRASLYDVERKISEVRSQL